MSRYCDHYACRKDLLDRFLFAVKDKSVNELMNELYPNRGLIHHEINHNWEDIHRCLTDDTTANMNFKRGSYPLRLCIHGGKWLMGGPGTMTLVRADELPALCAALKEIDR